MSIYNEIAVNKARTYVIIAIFIFLISGLFFLIGKYFENPVFYFTIGILIAVISSVWSYYNSDKVVLFTTGAKPATKEKYFNFYTVTENLALADGLPMPKLYVMQQPAMNAFATGRDPKHAVVCATSGLLEKLNRTELEGVIAHELSHVKNYDILLSSIVAVLVGVVAIATDWILRTMWWGGNDDERDNRNPIMFVFLILALIISPLVATLIQLAVSRRREFLADASGALLTRYPEGLARALEKISADKTPLWNISPSTAHLFISNPFQKKSITSWISNLYSTHPPAEERIKILRSM